MHRSLKIHFSINLRRLAADDAHDDGDVHDDAHGDDGYDDVVAPLF